MSYLFTSESVSEGHPDKICDQISDAVLDAALTNDPKSRVAVETLATTGLVLVAGELTTSSFIDINGIVRNTLKDIGYTKPEYGIDGDSCAILNTLHEQSPDIAQGVDKDDQKQKELGAGDQGMMFGFACKQTPELMPMPIMLAHKLVRQLAALRKSKVLSYLRPDAKAQITLEYDNGIPKSAHTVVISSQHDPDTDPKKLEKDLIEEVIKPTVPSHLLTADTRIFINPTGRFVTGGPHGDSGLTGRKIIVDTYGGWIAHGGGAFSGKDATKVDRSAAYMARYVAKNIVAADLADEVTIQLAYAIGVAEPVSVYVDTKGTGKISNAEITRLIRSVFNLTPEGIITTLGLTRPMFKQTATYGHFGRDDLNLSWEQTNKVEQLKTLATTAHHIS